MLMELEGFASDWTFVASFIQFKISCYDQRECPAFENREDWGSQSSYAMRKSKVGRPPMTPISVVLNWGSGTEK
jgi:hypothetical protein